MLVIYKNKNLVIKLKKNNKIICELIRFNKIKMYELILKLKKSNNKFYLINTNIKIKINIMFFNII